MRLSKDYWVTLSLLMLLLLSGCQTIQPPTPKVDQGKINLAQWDFKTQGNIKMDGQWEFYWDQLISPGNFGDPSVKLTGYYKVPWYWTKYKDLNLPSHGYATYRAVIVSNGQAQPLSIKTPEIYTEYKLWANGKPLYSNGSFAKKPLTYMRPDVHTFYTHSSRIEIVLQIKNYKHCNSGIGQSLLLGAPGLINQDRNIKSAHDAVLFAFCLFAGIYNTIIFIYRKNERELIYFAGLCFAAAIRTILSNETWAMQILPSLPYEIGSRVLTLTVPLCAAFMLFYTLHLYKEEMPRPIFNLLMGFNGLYILSIVTTPVFFYSSQFNNYLYTVDLTAILVLYCVIKAMKKGDRQASIFLIGVIFLGVAAFNDMLYFNQLIDTSYYLSLGLTFFITVQVILLSIRYYSAYLAIERLSENLQQSLDKISVTENAFLQAQIKPHFLYNALNTIAEYCDTDSRQAGSLILSLSKYLRGTLNFENLGGIIDLKKELELVNAYTNIEKARFEDINVEFHIDPELPSLQLPSLSLQPLVENAIKHGLRQKEGGGTVKVKICQLESAIVFAVEDDGAGMAEDLADKTLNVPSETASIGLYNIHSRLLRLYGQGLTIESTPGAGTRVSFVIPYGREM